MKIFKLLFQNKTSINFVLILRLGTLSLKCVKKFNNRINNRFNRISFFHFLKKEKNSSPDIYLFVVSNLFVNFELFNSLLAKQIKNIYIILEVK